MAANKRLQVRVDPTTLSWLRERAATMKASGPDIQARTELGIWRMVMLGELRRLRKALTLAQARCLTDVLRDVPMSEILGQIAYSEAHDVFATLHDSAASDGRSAGETWGIDEDALLHWLAQLTPVADYALRNAIAEWWHAGYDLTAEGFGRVGLVIAYPRGLQVSATPTAAAATKIR